VFKFAFTRHCFRGELKIYVVYIIYIFHAKMANSSDIVRFYFTVRLDALLHAIEDFP